METIQKLKKFLGLSVLLLIIGTSTPFAQSIVYVDKDATGNNDGTSWEDAYTELRDASGSEIWVAEGTYKPTSGTDRTERFSLGGEVYGGFSGTETSLDERDIEANETVLSGDIGVEGDSTDNSYTVIWLQGATSSTIIDGFTIQDGNADADLSLNPPVDWGRGGGIFCDASVPGICNPTLRNLVFKNNFAKLGGSLFLNGTNGQSNATLENLVIKNNTADNAAGIYVNANGGESSVTFINVTIYGNMANSHPAINFDAREDGISTSSLTNVLIWGNSDSSPDILLWAAELSITNSLIEDFGEVAAISTTSGGNYTDDGGNLDSDPLFVDAENGDFRLSKNSPAIDAGKSDASGLPDTDITGDTRLKGAVDIGAYESGMKLEVTGSEGWRMMTSPLTSSAYGDLFEDVWVQGIPTGDYEGGNPNLLLWDEATATFQKPNALSDQATTGNGFIFHFYDDDNYNGKPDGFPKELILLGSEEESSPFSFTITATDRNSNSSIDSDEGWNLVGNPFATTVNWNSSNGWTKSNIDNTIYIWSEADNEYKTWNGSDGSLPNGLIAPWQGFWVKGNDTNPSLQATKEVKKAGGVFRKETAITQLEFTISNGNHTSRSLVMFSEDASTEKDPLDAYKLQPLSDEYLSLYTSLNNGDALDINALPSDLEGTMEIDLNFEGTNLATDFELEWDMEALPSDWEFSLMHNESGEIIDLKERSAFSFTIDESMAQKTKTTKAENDFESPNHKVISPEVMKSSNDKEPHFTLLINSGEAVSNEADDQAPQQFALEQNYPNPFNPTTVINYHLPENSVVSLRVFDMLGREVASLLDRERRSAGSHAVTFHAENLSSGVYIYRLEAGNTVLTRKLTLIK